MNAGPFQNTSNEDLRIEALRQAVFLWKHWDDTGMPAGDQTLIGLSEQFFKFLTGQPAEASAA